jgi:hypothetical protein
VTRWGYVADEFVTRAHLDRWRGSTAGFGLLVRSAIAAAHEGAMHAGYAPVTKWRAEVLRNQAGRVYGLRVDALVGFNATIRCPACHRVSHHPEDVRQGYCGACHAFTTPRP